ncbi:MAG: hypothetical protein PUD71_06605, partial [Lachnospiraceae bacterium]|nr:hypothetical protein [Lachnospiraceae bacterium]
DREVTDFFYEGLCAVGGEHDTDYLLSVVLKTGEVNFKCLEFPVFSMPDSVTIHTLPSRSPSLLQMHLNVM